MVSKGGERIEVLGLESKCKKITRKEVGCGLTYNPDIASPVAKVGTEVSLAQTGCIKRVISSKRSRLYQLLDSDCGIHTDLPSHGTANLTIDTTKVKITTPSRKISDGRKDKKLKTCKKEVLAMLRQQAEKLRVENSSFTKKLLEMSELCQEMTLENDLLLSELKSEYGPEQISDLSYSNPASCIST